MLDKQNVKCALAVNIQVRQRLHVHHVKQVNIRQVAQIRVVLVLLENILARLEVVHVQNVLLENMQLKEQHHVVRAVRVGINQIQDNQVVHNAQLVNILQ